MRRLVVVAIALLALAALRDVARLGDAAPWHRQYDFQDFYCAGTALDDGANPYLYEPLHRCEHAVNATPAYRGDPARAVPAPLPPYDFPPLMLLAHLPFPQARTIDAVAILCAVAAAMLGLSMLRIPLDLPVLALILPAGYVLLDAGQIVPFALLFIVFCGVTLARGYDAIAGVLAAMALAEPHLGLPVLAAVLILVPRARAAATITLFVLAVAGTFTVGANGTLEYVLRVLPAQAAAETTYVYQYSLTYLLARAGLPAPAALLLGNVTYVGVAALGVVLGARASFALRRRELIAYFPAAASVIGGAYVHMVDLPVAIPAALVLAVSLRGRAKTIAALSTCGFAIPWIAVWINKKLFLASLAVVAMLLVRLQLGTAIAAGSFAVIALTIYLFELFPPPAFPSGPTTAPIAPNDLAQTAWAAYVARIGQGTLGWLLIKVPTWGALAGLLLSGLKAGPPDTPGR